MVYNFITMIEWLIKKLLGTKSDREVKRLRKVVQRITQREAELDKLSKVVELSIFNKAPAIVHLQNTRAWTFVLLAK